MFDTRADIWRINKNVDFYEKTRTYVLFLLYGKKKLENEGIHFESVVKKLKIKYKENISWWHSMYTAQNRMEWLILIWSLFFFFFFFFDKRNVYLISWKFRCSFWFLEISDLRNLVIFSAFFGLKISEIAIVVFYFFKYISSV